jgi:N-carbamoylputrescine amidase
MDKVCIAVTQFKCTNDIFENIARAERVVRNAAAAGANVVVLQELFHAKYFCQEQNPDHFVLAETAEDSFLIHAFSELAKELEVVIPVPFFEKDGNNYYNSVAVVDSDGEVLGVYRKTHIPQGECYNEKFYFVGSKNEFEVFETKLYGKLGCLICFDQWFPEAVRALALQGADYIVMPTAIGSEPEFPNGETYLHWARVIQGHSAANGVPIAVSNRIGRERFGKTKIDFYGGSFITDNKGAIVVQVGGEPEHGNPDPSPVPLKGYVNYEFDMKDNEKFRAFWGIFRDRRPELYDRLVV